MPQNFTYTDYSNTDPFHSVCIWYNINVAEMSNITRREDCT